MDWHDASADLSAPQQAAGDEGLGAGDHDEKADHSG
jgi:hypothetical protein